MTSEIAFTSHLFKVKDKLSALTHFIGFVFSVFAMPAILIKGSTDGSGPLALISYAIFTLSMCMLYGASTAYHTFDIGIVQNKRLRKFDHMMIPVLIAGTYTPLCVGPLRNEGGIALLAVIWSLTALSILFSALWVTCPKWISSVIYIAMGWACVPFIAKLHRVLPTMGFMLLLLGGIIYTIGGVIYACKLKVLEKNKEFRSHELFHCFIMGGSLCHFLVIYLFVA